MQPVGYLLTLLSLLAALGAFAAASERHSLRQATRVEVVRRLTPDRTRGAKKRQTSPTPTPTGCNPDGAQPTFFLQGSGSGTNDDGQFAVLSDKGFPETVSFGSDESAATSFTFNGACNLVGPIGEVAAAPATGSAGNVFTFYTPQEIAADDFVAATCDILDEDLQCTSPSGSHFFVLQSSPSQLHVGTAPARGADVITLGTISE